MPAEGPDRQQYKRQKRNQEDGTVPACELFLIPCCLHRRALPVELMHQADLGPGFYLGRVPGHKQDRHNGHDHPEDQPELEPAEERKADDPLSHADRERVHEGRGEPGIRSDQGDTAGNERVISQ